MTLDLIAKKGEIPESERKVSKTTVTHLYKIIGRLDLTKFLKFDYLMSFGVSIESKVLLQKAIEKACDYEEFKGYLGIVKFNFLEQIPLKEIMIIHKYYTFAVKKM